MMLKSCRERNIDPLRKVLYRNFHDIEGVIYLVEISRNKNKVFILLFPNFEAPDIFLSEIISEKKAQQLMVESNNQFEDLIARFYIKYGKLQIFGYHGKNHDPRKTRTNYASPHSLPQIASAQPPTVHYNVPPGAAQNTHYESTYYLTHDPNNMTGPSAQESNPNIELNNLPQTNRGADSNRDLIEEA
jgi:hypothetical protein